MSNSLFDLISLPNFNEILALYSKSRPIDVINFITAKQGYSPKYADILIKSNYHFRKYFHETQNINMELLEYLKSKKVLTVHEEKLYSIKKEMLSLLYKKDYSKLTPAMFIDFTPGMFDVLTKKYPNIKEGEYDILLNTMIAGNYELLVYLVDTYGFDLKLNTSSLSASYKFINEYTKQTNPKYQQIHIYLRAKNYHSNHDESYFTNRSVRDLSIKFMESQILQKTQQAKITTLEQRILELNDNLAMSDDLINDQTKQISDLTNRLSKLEIFMEKIISDNIKHKFEPVSELELITQPESVPTNDADVKHKFETVPDHIPDFDSIDLEHTGTKHNQTC